ncbi:hypothetical protein, partial [Alistipes communis]|uniref:hypothetical protein n=1 Tax=Alistipes communis TaxID=2585118 RepID=UPI003AB1569D
LGQWVGEKATRQGFGHKKTHLQCAFFARIHIALPVAAHPLPLCTETRDWSNIIQSILIVVELMK